MFLDEAIIDVSGGAGGRGCVSWRREKFVPYGGPDGGDGGQGGSVFIVADANTDTLSDFASRKRFEAQKGWFGSGKNKRGKDGEDKTLKVPPGCQVFELPADGQEGEPVLVADLREPGEQVVIARGGRGGFGNAHFVSSVRQKPDFAELGEPGQRKRVKLELKLVADAGIIGYPSVGKSTLISVISAAKPKIAAYHFTTLVPNLGVVNVDDRSYVVCDVPGLIEGASEGRGLGDAFLKHIERCGALLHVLDLERALGDGNSIDVDVLDADYRMIRKELDAYSPALTAKRELVILNKSDLVAGETAGIEKELQKRGIPVFMSISAATRQGTAELTKKLLPVVLEERQKRTEIVEEEEAAAAGEMPVIRPHLASDRMGAFRIITEPDGTLRVKGRRIEQMAVMTDYASRGGVIRLRDIADRTGLLKALQRAGRTEDTRVFIGDVRVDEAI